MLRKTPVPYVSNTRPIVSAGPWSHLPGLDLSEAPDGSSWLWLNGWGRSGTTVLARILSEHPAIKVTNEDETVRTLCGLLLTDYWHDQQTETLLLSWDKHGGYTTRDLRAFADTWRAIKCPGVALAGDKAPFYWWRRDFWRRLFPGSRFVYSYRHPLDQLASLYAADPSTSLECFDGTRASACDSWQRLVRPLVSNIATAAAEGMVLFNFDAITGNSRETGITACLELFATLTGDEELPWQTIENLCRYLKPRNPLTSWRGNADIAAVLAFCAPGDRETSAALLNWPDYVKEQLANYGN